MYHEFEHALNPHMIVSSLVRLAHAMTEELPEKPFRTHMTPYWPQYGPHI